VDENVMCRLAAYLGKDIVLKQFLIEPPHSLMVQAWNPQELIYAKLNADGYGFGWYNDDGDPAVYTNPMPIWSDVNLPHLAGALRSDLWLAMVRSATPGLPVNHANTQPFHDADLLFAHNGFIRDFSTTVRPVIRQFLDPVVEAGIQGNTDSEFLFALLRHLLADDDDLSVEAALIAMFDLLEDWTGDRAALLNIVVTDGERLIAARHALHHECPSLYYTTDDDGFPGGQLIASERLTAADFWQPVPEHHILILDPQAPPELIDL
jgi:glutamine amidotransferase